MNLEEKSRPLQNRLDNAAGNEQVIIGSSSAASGFVRCNLDFKKFHMPRIKAKITSLRSYETRKFYFLHGSDREYDLYPFTNRL